MNVHPLLDTGSISRIAVALTLVGGVLLLYARLLFGPFPGGRCRGARGIPSPRRPDDSRDGPRRPHWICWIK